MSRSDADLSTVQGTKVQVYREVPLSERMNNAQSRTLYRSAALTSTAQTSNARKRKSGLIDI